MNEQTWRPEVVVLENFLNDHEHQALIDHARTNRSDLAASGILDTAASGAVDHDVRKSMVGEATVAITSAFSERLHALLPHMRKEVDVPWFELDHIETQFTAHGDGDFFAVHTDNGAGPTRSRKLTYVYYFHIPPQGFEGGELIVYDWHLRNHELGPGGVAHRVQPADNTIVFFPSNAYHEVRPVLCPGDDHEDHRYTVNGWFHAVPTVEDIVELDQQTNAQRLVVPHLHPTGFELGDTSEDLQHRLRAAWAISSDAMAPEEGDPRPYPAGPPQQTPLNLDPNDLLEELQAEHEQWADTDLEPTSVVGFRTFGAGQTERPHTHRVESHVVTTIYCIDRTPEHDDSADLSEAPDPPSWGVYVVDHDGNEHHLSIAPGQHLRVETASCPVGFADPLPSGTATFLMIHYRPADWDWDEPRMWDTIVEQGYFDAPT